MASQKQTRAAAGRNSSGTRTRAGSGTSTRGSSGTAARSSQSGQDRNGRGQNTQARNGRGQSGQDRNDGRQGRVTATQARPATQAAGSPAAKAPGPPVRTPLWFQLTTLIVSLGGLGMSIYLTIAHYTTTSILVCSDKGYVNCAKVTTSPESVVFGIFPVAVLGLAFYVFMVAITTPWAWRSPLLLIAWLRTAAIIAGMGFAIYLIYAEIIEIGNICILCTTVHIVTFLLFVLLMSVAPFRLKARAARDAL